MFFSSFFLFFKSGANGNPAKFLVNFRPPEHVMAEGPPFEAALSHVIHGKSSYKMLLYTE